MLGVGQGGGRREERVNEGGNANNVWPCLRLALLVLEPPVTNGIIFRSIVRALIQIITLIQRITLTQPITLSKS